MELTAIISCLTAVPEARDWPELLHALERVGNRPRPDWALPVIACEAVGGKSSTAWPAAAAMACMQISIMLVDDILDDDPRGEHIRSGVGPTANMALAFQALAFRVLEVNDITPEVRAGICSRLAWMAQTTALGQNWDSRNLSGQDDYWRVVRAKSTPFYGAALQVGAMLGQADADTVDRLRDFGMITGEVIQILDDLEDAFQVPANPDWKLGRNNLPILYALSVKHADHSRFMSLLANVDDPGNLREAQHILITCGAVSYCAYQLIIRYNRAQRLLQGLDLPNPAPVQDLLEEHFQAFAGLLRAAGVFSPSCLHDRAGA